MKSSVMITAHSGCEETPDNSIASIETAVRLEADCVEIDLRADRDGGLFLTHDMPDSFSGLVSLETAFEAIRRGGIAVNCDLKEECALLPTLETAKFCGIGREQLIFSGSVSPCLLEQNPDITDHCRIFLNSEVLVRDLFPDTQADRLKQTELLLNNIQRAAERLHALRAAAINFPYAHMSPALFTELRKRCIGISLWTLNDEDVLRKYMKMDVLNITTRKPSTALSIRRLSE